LATNRNLGLAQLAVSASIVTADLLNLEAEFERLLAAGVDSLHLDLEDGIFAPAMNLGTRLVEAAVRWEKLPVDVHLMVEEPERIITLLKGLPLQTVAFHAEATRYPRRVLGIIRDLGWRASIAFNPATRVADLSPLMPYLDNVLMLTTEPEQIGSPFLEACLPHVRGVVDEVTRLGVSVTIDGGVGISNIGLIADTGASTVVVGRALFESTNLAQTVARIKKGDSNE